MKKIDVKIVKNSIPIIWLDTNIISDISRIKLNIPFNKDKKKKIQLIYESVTKEIENKKLISPQSEQLDEIKRYIQNPDRYKKFLDKSYQLLINFSKGFKFSNHDEIQRHQIRMFMKGAKEQSNNIQLKVNDCLEVLTDFKFINFPSSSTMEGISEEIQLNKKYKTKVFSLKHWEDLRKTIESL